MKTTLIHRAMTTTLFLSAALGGVTAAHADATSEYFVANGAATTDDSATAAGANSVAAGPAAAASGAESTALGHDATAVSNGASAIGSGATATGAGAIAIGRNASTGTKASNPGNIAIGDGAIAAGGHGAIALGTSAVTSNYDSIAIGDHAKTAGSSATAIGVNAQANSYDTVAIGAGAKADVSLSTALGYGAAANSQAAVALGYKSVASGVASVAIGDGAVADSTGPGNPSTAIGYQAHAVGSAVGLGSQANASAVNSTALGTSTSVAEVGGSAIGAGAKVVAGATGAVALGQGSVADRANTVSVGAVGAERQIANVAAGTADTDAVNVAQLKQAGLVGSDGSTLDALVYDAGSNRSIVTLGGVGAASAVTMTNVAAGRIAADSTDAVNGSQLFQLSSRVDALSGSAGTGSGDFAGSRGDSGAVDGGGQRVTNVAAGVADTDAANVGQLNSAVDNGVQQANAYTNQQVNSLRSDVDGYRKDANAGSASAIAMANLPQAVLPGERVVSLAGGTFGGQSAMAVGLSTATQKWMVKGSLTTNTRGSVGAGAGVGYRW